MLPEKDPTAVRGQQPVDDVEQGRFAGAVGPDDGFDDSGPHLETDPVQGLESFKSLGHLSHLQERGLNFTALVDGAGWQARGTAGWISDNLFGKRRAYQRKVAVADFDGVCSSDIYVFELVDKEWIPIENLMDYGYGENGGIYLENKGPFAKYSTVITPAVTVDDDNILMRIVCIGEFVSPDGKTIQQAGAYRDFWLTPDRTVKSLDDKSL